MTEDNTEMIREIILETILIKVFKFIDEKQAHLLRRKTWALKRQEEQVQIAKKKRQEWKIENNSVANNLRALCGGE